MFWLSYSSHSSHHPSQTPWLPWISYPLENWSSSHAKLSKSNLKDSIRFCGIFPNLKQIFIAYHSSKMSSCPDCIFEIHQPCQSGFSKVYSNFCCSCSFEYEITKIGQSSHKKYSNNVVNFQESMTILNGRTKNLETYWKPPPHTHTYIYIYIYIYVYDKWYENIFK